MSSRSYTIDAIAAWVVENVQCIRRHCLYVKCLDLEVTDNTPGWYPEMAIGDVFDRQRAAEIILHFERYPMEGYRWTIVDGDDVRGCLMMRQSNAFYT